MKPPVLLAIDSSTESLCLAACVAGQQRCWHGVGGAQASVELLVRAKGLLAELGVSLGQLDAVAFARGPGAFTGLRTACATAQGLAFGVGCAVLPIDSLMIVALAGLSNASGVSTDPVVGVAMDARMGELYAGRYGNTAQGWRVVEVPCLTSPSALADRWQARLPDLVVGSGLELLAEVPGWSESPSRSIVRVTDEDRTAALLALARQAWHAGEARPAEEALPLYVRDKVALTVAERQAQARIATAGS